MRILLAVSFTLVAAACAGSGNGPTDGGSGGGASGGGASGGGTASGTGGGSSSDGGPALTWYRDVLPVAQMRCMGCHTEGGIGAFSMQSADTVLPQAQAMAAGAIAASRERCRRGRSTTRAAVPSSAAFI